MALGEDIFVNFSASEGRLRANWGPVFIVSLVYVQTLWMPMGIKMLRKISEPPPAKHPQARGVVYWVGLILRNLRRGVAIAAKWVMIAVVPVMGSVEIRAQHPAVWTFIDDFGVVGRNLLVDAVILSVPVLYWYIERREQRGSEAKRQFISD